jgi:hypothetical protein
MRFVALVVLTWLVACGGDAGESPFVGTWTYAATGMQTIDCDEDAFDDMTVPAGSWELVAGASADVETIADAPCPAIKFDVADRVATAQAGQGCTDSEQGITQTTAYTSFTLTLDSSGKTLTEAVQGTFAVSGSIVTSCTLVKMATSTKP